MVSIVAISPKKLDWRQQFEESFLVSFTVYYYLTRTHTQTKVFYLILVWTETSLLLLSKVYLKRNPFNYRAQIAAFALSTAMCMHGKAATAIDRRIGQKLACLLACVDMSEKLRT